MDRPCAVKIIDLKEKERKREDRELNALDKLRHPNIIYCHSFTVIDTGQISDYYG